MFRIKILILQLLINKFLLKIAGKIWQKAIKMGLNSIYWVNYLMYVLAFQNFL